jgi:hypothetical protein
MLRLETQNPSSKCGLGRLQFSPGTLENSKSFGFAELGTLVRLEPGLPASGGGNPHGLVKVLGPSPFPADGYRTPRGRVSDGFDPHDRSIKCGGGRVDGYRGSCIPPPSFR